MENGVAGDEMVAGEDAVACEAMVVSGDAVAVAVTMQLRGKRWLQVNTQWRVKVKTQL